MQSTRAALLEDLYRDRYPHFVRVATAITGDADSGRDAVQSGFAQAVRKRRSFRGSGPLEAWVWRIVVNEARRVRRPEPAAAPPAPEPATNGHASDDLGVRAAILKVGDSFRLQLTAETGGSAGAPGAGGHTHETTVSTVSNAGPLAPSGYGDFCGTAGRQEPVRKPYTIIR